MSDHAIRRQGFVFFNDVLGVYINRSYRASVSTSKMDFVELKFGYNNLESRVFPYKFLYLTNSWRVEMNDCFISGAGFWESIQIHHRTRQLITSRV